MKLYSILFLTLVTLACNEPNTSTEEETTIPNTDSLPVSPGETDLSGEHCYQYISGNDSVSLQMTINKSKVTGDLFYGFHEKDKNIGTIKGELMGDTLVADYTFNSEGSKSMRQVAFIIDDSTAREGYGEMIEEKNKMIFKNAASVRFDRSFVMVKVPCETN